MHSIKQLEAVRALAKYRHFGRAASALGVSQPNLTRMLRHMERTLDVALFDRQGVTPTLFGEIVLRHGATAMSGFEELFREIALTKGLEIGELRLSVAPYPADISAASALGALMQKSPKLFVEFRTANWANAVEEVINGAVDLGFAELSVASATPDIEVEPIRNSQMWFFCATGHPLTTKKRLVVEDLLVYPWVGPSLPGRMGALLPKRDMPFATFDETLDRFHPRALVGSFAIAKQVVLRGSALSAAIPFQIGRELREGLCVQLPLELPWMTLNYGFIYKKGRTLSPAAARFMANVREIEHGIP
jgi:DNA-binding transcriptional LysR family regulator